MALGQYDSPGEYCGPHTASSAFLILLLVPEGWLTRLSFDMTIGIKSPRQVFGLKKRIR